MQVLLLPNKGFKPELIWARVEKIDGNEITCQLLNQPQQNLGVKINDTITASFQLLEKENYLTCKIDLTTKENTTSKSKKPWWKFR